MGLEGLRFSYQPKPFVHDIGSFYRQVQTRISNSPKLFEFYAKQGNREKVKAAIALATEDWATGAPEQAVFMSVVRTYIKAMHGLKPAAGVKDWHERVQQKADMRDAALALLRERFEFYIHEGQPVDPSIIVTWRNLIDLATGAK